MANNADIELLAGLNINSSETEILKAIKVLEQRLQKNSNAKLNLDIQFDEGALRDAIHKLQGILKSKELKIETKTSIEAISKEADAMLEVVNAARKAAEEKLEFVDANRQVRESADATADAINREDAAMANLDDLDYVLSNINMNGRQGQSIFQQFGDTLRDAFYAYTAANLLQDALHELIEAGQEGVETVKELNDALTTLRMATGQSYESVKGLLGAYNALGQELGALTVDVSESADEWLRQGHSISATNELIKDSMMLSKISNLESAKSTKYLTSAMQGYRVAAEDVIDIVDKLSAVDLESATDAGGLAEAMSRTAEGARIAGISMDRLLGMIATVGEVTQKSMSSIGESYKTLFSRMRDIKDNKLSIIGEDGEIEDISNVEIVLESLGIKLRDSNLEFRNFQEVLDEVAASWDNYTSVQKAAVAKAFSGVRQQENFLVMMENWDKVAEYTNVAANSAGTAEEKFGYYLDSLEAKTNSLKASLENLASVTISDEMYASVLDATKAVVDMTAKTGVLKGALAGLGTAGSIYVFQNLAGYLRDAAQEFANLGEAMQITRSANGTITDIQQLINLTGGLSDSQTRLVLSTRNLTDAQKVAILMNQGLTRAEAQQQIQTWGVAAAQQGATGATISFSNALRGLYATLLANPLVAISAAVTIGVSAFTAYKQSQEETIRATKDAAEKANELGDEISTLATKYVELTEAVETDDGAKEELLSTQTELLKQLDIEADELDTLIAKYGSLSNAIKQASIDKLKESQIDLISGLNVAESELLESADSGFFKDKNTINATGADAVKAFAELEKAGLIGKGSYTSRGGALVLTAPDDTIEGALENYKRLEDALKVLRDSNEFTSEELADNPLYQAMYERYKEMQDEVTAYKTAVNDLNENLIQQNTLVMLQRQEIPKTQEAFDTFRDKIVSTAAASGDFIGSASDIRNTLDAYLASLPEFSAFYTKLAEVKDDAVGDSNSAEPLEFITEKQKTSLEDYQKSLGKLSDSISNLYNLNSTDITSLMTDFREYAHIFEEFGVTGEAGVGDVEGALRKIADTIRTEMVEKIPQMAGAINAIFDSLINHPKGDINKVRAELEELEKVYDDIADSKTMDMDAATALINKYPELAGAVEVVGDAYTFERDAIVDLINARIENFNAIASDEYDATQEALKNIQARIDGYMAEYNAMRTLSLARGNAFTNGLHTDKMYAKDQEHLSDPAYQKMLEEEQRLKELLDDLEEGTKKNFDLESIIGKSSKDTSQTFDWYETYLDRIGTKISELGNRANDSYSTWSKRNAELVNQLELLEGKKSVLEDIIKPAYEDKMGAIELEMKSSGMDVDKYTTLIKEGLWDSSNHTLGIETITDETQIELIEKYLEIYEKWLSVSQDANATNRELKDGECQKFENISKQFDNELSILESREASLNNMIALTEAKGYAVSSVVYGELKNVLAGQYLGKMAEQEELRKQLDDSMASGKITMFSDEWYEAKDAINQTTLECQDLNLAVIDCDKQVRQLEWDNFDRMMEAIHDVVEETEFLASLFSNADMVDEAGKITKEGLAVLGQYGVGYQTYMAKSKDYANELLDIREQLADDPYNLELQEREEELLGLQRESIQNAMDEKQAMIEIAQEAIQAQIDATQELVDKKKEALDAEQELREYQNSLTEKTDNLGNLRKQESVYALDNSEEGQQKLQTVRAQIKDAEKDLDEFTYSKWHQDQNTMLDELMAEYTELQEARSADTETLFNEMVTAVNTNAGVISELLNTKAQELGITLSGTAEAIWNKYVADTKYSNILTEYGGATSTDVTGVKDAIAGESGTNQRLQDINSSISGAEGTNQKLTTINDSLTSEAGLSGQVGKVTSALTGDNSIKNALTGENSITSALTGQNGVTNAIDDIKAQFEGNDGVIAKFGDITGALVGDDGTTVTGSVGKLWKNYKDEHDLDNTNLKNYNDKVYARWEAEDEAQTESDQKTSERWSATDEALKALSGDAFNILTGIQFMKDQLYGEGESGLTGIQSVLLQIFEWLEEGNLAININSAGNIGKGDNSDSTSASTVASAGISAATQVASIINKAKDISKTNSGSLIGQVIKSASGKWYTSSDGEEAGTAVNKYSPDYWKVDKYQKGAAYPYHIQAFIDDEPAGGSGWVKASQIGYKHGSKHITHNHDAWTQEGYGENELVYRASDGAIYTRVGPGDLIFTHEQTQKLWELTRGNLGVDYPMKQYRMPEMPTVVNGGNVYLDIGDVVLPNVREPEDFAVQLVDTLKHSSKAQKAIRAVSVDLLAGKSIMGVNRI